LCQYVVGTREPLVIEDACEHTLVRQNLAIPDLGVIAYLGIPLIGIPLITTGGQAVGFFCAIDSRPRAWTRDDFDIMRGLAASVMAEIELRLIARETQQRAEAAERERREKVALLDSATEGICGVFQKPSRR